MKAPQVTAMLYRIAIEHRDKYERLEISYVRRNGMTITRDGVVTDHATATWVAKLVLPGGAVQELELRPGENWYERIRALFD